MAGTLACFLPYTVNVQLFIQVQLVLTCIACIAFQSIAQLIEDTVPESIRIQRSMKMDDPLCKFIFFPSSLTAHVIVESAYFAGLSFLLTL